MKKCLLLINKKSGRGERAAEDKRLPLALRKYYAEVVTKYLNDGDDTGADIGELAVGFDALAVCGGDGTLNSAINATRNLNIELIYIPYGTLNDSAKCLQLTKQFRREDREIRRIDLGEIDGRLFTYVAAVGTFTPIGYTAKTKLKKRLKIFAYMLEVLKEYKVRRIKADITANGNSYSGEYSLIMAVNSKRCFGFNFNRLYKHNSGTAHLLLINAPRRGGLIGAISMFFPFFRAFFIGFDKLTESKNIKFIEFSEAEINLKEEVIFNVDGERLPLSGKIPLKIHRQRLKLYVF